MSSAFQRHTRTFLKKHFPVIKKIEEPTVGKLLGLILAQDVSGN